MFRPMPILSFLMLPALALLVWLGSWQWARMGEKADAIAAWENRQTETVLPLETALCDVRAGFYGREIELQETATGATLRFQGRSPAGAPGWLILSAARVPECFSPAAGEFVLVQTGFESFRGETGTPPATLVIARLPDAGAFAAENLPASNEYYRFNPEQMAAALDVASVTDAFWLVEASAEMPAELATVPPGQHLGYALTWWGLAIGLIAVYLVMHVQSGRLRFTRR